MKKIPQWKKNQKSVFKELGWGNMKEGGDKLRDGTQWQENIGRFICPDCGENRTTHIQEARAGFWYCDICGYENDTDYWYKQTQPKKKGSRLPT